MMDYKIECNGVNQQECVEEGEAMSMDKMSDEELVKEIQAEAVRIGMGGYTKEHIDKVEKYEADLLSRLKCGREAIERVQNLEKEVEYEQMRLAACGVAAMSNTEETIKDRLTVEHEYHSGSYDSVCAAVDREMKYREQLREVEELVENLKCCGNCLNLVAFNRWKILCGLTIQKEEKEVGIKYICPNWQSDGLQSFDNHLPERGTGDRHARLLKNEIKEF